jgi:peptidyl-prolyl cis-trans isomerase D
VLQQDRLRQVLGATFDPEPMNTPEATLGRPRTRCGSASLAARSVQRHGWVASDDAAADVISKIPALQEDGQFSMARYQAALAAQGMSQSTVRSAVASGSDLQQLVAAIGDTAIIGSK